MRIHPLHSWDVTPKEAVALQRELAARVDASRPLRSWTLVAGADVSHQRFGKTCYAGVVIVRLPDFEVVERQGAVGDVTFPYVPGLLTFREAPVLMEAFARVKSEPDVVLLDGQGVAHPRRLGLAAHIGLWLDRPCIGCAKSRLIGQLEGPAAEAGSTSPLLDRGEVIGAVVRTRTNVQPLYISVGNRIDLESAVRVVLATGRGYRVPEPTRLAHHHVNELRLRGQHP